MSYRPNETRVVIYGTATETIQRVIDILRNACPRGFSNSPILPNREGGELHAICSIFVKEVAQR